MNPDQQTRLEIMQVLEKDFPDRLLEDLTEVARYVEAGGIERVREESQDSAAKTSWEAAYLSEPRTWTNLERIPDDVRAVTDQDGDVIRRVVECGLCIWRFEAARYMGITVNNDFGPFTEVLP